MCSMLKFQIKYGLGGGFGGCDRMDWETIEARDHDHAEELAREESIREYESYEGLHGLRTVDQIMEEDECVS